MRTAVEAPLAKRVIKVYNNSRVGLFSTRIAEYSHSKFYQMSEYVAYKLTLFRIRRRIGFLSVTLGGLFLGYLQAGYGHNWFTLGWRQHSQ